MAEGKLDFAEPLLELVHRAEALQRHAQQNRLHIDGELRTLFQNIQEVEELFQKNLTPWQKVRLARHPMRPHPQYFCRMIFSDFMELHGDRRFGDDWAVGGGFAMLGTHPVMVIFTRKGHNLEQYLQNHFGCPEPEGYRKALRLMKLAEKARCPIVTLVDTPGAYPGISGGERHIGEAIAVNLREMFRLTVPVVCVITGEGGSGGALGLAVGNKVLMLTNAYYSVITPEGCAAILWRDENRTADAARALKLTAEDLLKLNVIDEIVPEPLGGAHCNPGGAAAILKAALMRVLKPLWKKSPSRVKDARYDRFRKMGVFQEK